MSVDPERGAGRHASISSLPAHTVIYSRAMPAASNIMAWHLARTTQRPWVAHFSDEWPPTRRCHIARHGSRHTRCRCSSCGGGGFCAMPVPSLHNNPRQAKVVLGSAAGRFMSKAFVVTHLPSMAGCRDQVPQQDNLFHIVHTGNLNPPNHSSAALLQGLRIFLDRTPRAQEAVSA